MKKLFTLLFIAFLMTGNLSMAPEPISHKFFNKTGEEVSFDNMVEELKKADVILFGEYHNNAISHWMQFELTKALFESDSTNLVLGAEMFEADDQLILNEYLAGQIKESSFKKEAKVWPNYATDYKPLVEFAKSNDLEFIATNIPRRYASIVASKGLEGLDSLSAEAKKYIAPLPMPYDPELACYKNMLMMMGGMGGHKNTNLPKAQASKDATMAHFINENMKENSIFLHYNGAYHSDNFESIVWYLKQYNPNLKVMTISTRDYESLDKLKDEDLNLADFVLCVNSDIAKTH